VADALLTKSVKLEVREENPTCKASPNMKGPPSIRGDRPGRWGTPAACLPRKRKRLSGP